MLGQEMLRFWGLILAMGLLSPSQGLPSLGSVLDLSQMQSKGLLGTGLGSQGLINKESGLLGTGLLGDGGILGTGILSTGSPNAKESGGSSDAGKESSSSGILGTGLLGGQPGSSGLLGTGILGGGKLLGNDIPGGDKLLGNGILGEEGLGNGLVGNVIPGNGLLGNGVLGNDLPGNGLLGNGVPGNGLLGNGVLGNDLPGNGLPGNGLLGNGVPGNGLLSNDLLGNDLLSNVIPGNDLLGNGLLGNMSLLGQKGLLGTGLLGEGLLGNGSLLGLDGVLGAGALLGNGVPGTPTLFSWLKVLNLENVRVSCRVVHGSEFVLNLYSRLVLRLPGVFRFLSGSSVETNITSHMALTQDTPGDLKLVAKDCSNLLVHFNVNSRSGFFTNMVTNMLNRTLRSLIPALLCPLVNIWVSIINFKLQFLNRVLSFGLLGKIHSALSRLPLTSGHYLELDLQNYPFPSAFIDWLLHITGINLGSSP